MVVRTLGGRMVRPDDPRLVRRRALREVNTEMWDTLVAEGFTPTPEVAMQTPVEAFQEHYEQP